MIFDSKQDLLSDFINRYGWVQELAGILPLSALIDFIDIPPKIHILQLIGAVPLWSWLVTPAGSRLLLARQDWFGSQDCLLDVFGNTPALETLDGRYGERYFAKSPETLRLVIGAHSRTEMANDHPNMGGDNLRVHNLEVVHLTRGTSPEQHERLRPYYGETLLHQWRAASTLYLVVNLGGWVLLVGLVVMSVMFEIWISLSFLLLGPATGLVVSYLFGFRPRKLLVDNVSDYNRLLLVTEHMNSTDWTVVYGESTIVNSMLNRSLEPCGPSHSPGAVEMMRYVLRLFILGQWGLALAAAATKTLDSYLICFWITFCNLSHGYLITPERGAKSWSGSMANLKVERYRTQLSSRRTLLNVVVALNPDTFGMSRERNGPDTTQFYGEGMKWIDPILAQSRSRSQWEEATREAIAEVAEQGTSNEKGVKAPCFSDAWNSAYMKKCYWAKFIGEGIYIAAKIREAANLPERKVRRDQA